MENFDENTFNVTIELTYLQWNIVKVSMFRLPFAEVLGVLEKIQNQIGDTSDGSQTHAQSDVVAVSLSIEEFNVILTCVKMLPFNDSFEIVNKILVSGNEQISEMRNKSMNKKAGDAVNGDLSVDESVSVEKETESERGE